MPDWIEQLPYLPQLMIDTLTQSKQLTAINESLQQRIEEDAIQLQLQRARSLRNGLILAALAAACLLPQFSTVMLGVPLPSLLLGVGAVYLLCFKR